MLKKLRVRSTQALLRRVFAALLLGALLVSPATAQIEQPDVLEVLELKGEVSSAWAKQIKAEVEQYNEKSKAVLIVLDSPGGGVLATQEVYQALAKVKIPVVVWCDNVCASGGLYIAMSPSVKHFAVRDISITGSMGVIMSGLGAHRLLDWAKLDPYTFKSGALKDSGSGSRPMTPADQAYLQGIVDDLAQRFYAVVQKARPRLSAAALDDLKTAKIVFGDQAVKMGLADSVTDLDGAVKKAKELSKSDRIYTRDELKKMAKAAERPRTQSWGYNQAPATWESDLHSMVELLEEIRTGRTQRFLYMMPFKL